MAFSYEGYWILVNAPHTWAIDRFLRSGITEDSWGIAPQQSKHFRPGDLAFIRVGVDKRNGAQRDGQPKLRPGIYAFCEVTSKVFPGSGANGGYWYGNGRVDGWPTVRIRYKNSYLKNPLLIETLKRVAPDIDHLVLNGFQASSFPITTTTFRRLKELLGEA